MAFLFVSCLMLLGLTPVAQRRMEQLRRKASRFLQDLRDELDAFGRTPAPIRIKSETRRHPRR